MNLTPEKRELGRRNFIKAVAATPVAGALVWKATSMTPVRAGIIGVGGQGGVLLENAPPSHLRISAVCDIFPENRERALKIAKERHDAEAVAYEDYRQMLDRRDLEAIVIATPLWLHAPMSLDALAAGKHVFCEKNMAMSIEDCRKMMESAKSARKNLQIGHQRNYNPLYHEAKQLIDSGALGDIYHVRAVWHRNGDWRRPVPQDSQFDPRPWGYENLEHLKNWRLYGKYSLGLMSELGSHQLQVVNWFFNAVPSKVYGTGGVVRYQDGREVPDHVYVMYEYPNGRTFTFSSIQSNAWDHYYELFFGTQGTLMLSGEREALLFYEGSREATQVKVENVSGDAPVMQASASRASDAAGSSVSSSSAGFNALTAYRLELEGFAQTIRDGRPNLCEGPEAMKAAVSTLLGQEAVMQQTVLPIHADLYPPGAVLS